MGINNARHKYYTARVSIRKCMLKLVSQKSKFYFRTIFIILEYNIRSQFDLIIIRCQNTLSLNIMLTISLHSADNNK